jgi:uncharacterized glyoxalase superfamily protein PhnB
MRKPTLSQINLVSGDFDASLAFYRKLGVDIPEERVWRTPTGGHHANAVESSAGEAFHFDLDSTAYAALWNSAWAGRDDLKGRVVVGFRVSERPDVDTIFRRMTEAGHPGLQPPTDAHWGARYAIVEDPDGIAVCLMSPISSDRKTRPPEV